MHSTVPYGGSRGEGQRRGWKNLPGKFSSQETCQEEAKAAGHGNEVGFLGLPPYPKQSTGCVANSIGESHLRREWCGWEPACWTKVYLTPLAQPLSPALGGRGLLAPLLGRLEEGEGPWGLKERLAV